MKRTICLLVAIAASLTFLTGVWTPQSARAEGLAILPLSPILADAYRNPVDDKLGEVGAKEKIDLNNSPVRVFRQYRGLFPTLAGKIVDNAPYEAVEEVLEIPGLTAPMKATLQANLDNFVVTPPIPELVDGDGRINDGYY